MIRNDKEYPADFIRKISAGLFLQREINGHCAVSGTGGITENIQLNETDIDNTITRLSKAINEAVEEILAIGDNTKRR